MDAGYQLKKGECVRIEFIPIEQCPVVGDYIIGSIKTFEIRVSDRETRGSDGRLIKNLLENGAGEL